ncbi:hypothetical protein LCGC14_1094410 [marine sediment metagenome]|uniref:Uncharacterized protein n=1 Tax=marine sediment metagenome TaxID=412755 RepID=A0A0F9MZ38_9ZZZZ
MKFRGAIVNLVELAKSFMNIVDKIDELIKLLNEL